MGKPLESTVQRRCQQLLRENDSFVFKTHGDVYARVGLPDLVACVPVTESCIETLLREGWFKTGNIGIFLGLEIKRKDLLSNVSEAQRIVGDEIKNAGGLWFAIDDPDKLLALIYKLRGKL